MLFKPFGWILGALLWASAAPACDGRVVSDDRVFAAPLCIPVAPQRIVVMDHSFSLGIGLELGLPLVGAPLTRMSDAALVAQAQAAGLSDIGFIAQPSLEAVVALQPDLILAFTGDVGLAETYYPLLSGLAPTMINTSGDWRSHYDLLAGLNGTEDSVAALFDAFETRLADVRARMPETPVSLLRLTTWDFQIYTDAPDAYAPFEIAAAAGLIRSRYETAPEGPALKRPDWEELAQLDGDVLFYIVGGSNDSDTNGRHEEVLANPLFQRLPAVRAGRLYRLDPGTWMEFSGLPSAHRVLDDLERFVIGP